MLSIVYMYTHSHKTMKLKTVFIALATVLSVSAFGQTPVAVAPVTVPSSWGGTFGFDFKTSKVLTLGTYTYTLTRNSLNIKGLSFGVVGFGGGAVNGPVLAGGALGAAYTMKTWQIVGGYGYGTYASGSVDGIAFLGAQIGF